MPLFLSLVISHTPSVLIVSFHFSKYSGDKWDSFYDQLPLSLVSHINGNAIYNISHPLLTILVNRLEEEANTPYNAIPYDYRISQIMVETETGIIPEIPEKIWNEQKENGWEKYLKPIEIFVDSVEKFIPENPLKETKLIANYAATYVLSSHIGNEVIIHGATVHEEWNRAKEVRVILCANII